MNDEKMTRSRWVRILPLCFAVNFFAFIANLIVSFTISPGSGMREELQLTATVLGSISGVFAIGRLFLQVKTADMANKGRSKKLVIVLLICSSILTILQGLCQNGTQMIILRFLLGVAVGGATAVPMVLVSNWFPQKERGRAITLYWFSPGLSQIVLGPFAGWFLSNYSWRSLYITIGIIFIIIAIAWTFLVEDRPEDAKWLDATERDYIVNSLTEEYQLYGKMAKGGSNEKKRISLGDLLKDKNIWILSFMTFAGSCGTMGFGMWMPTLIQQISKANIQNLGLLVVIPNIIVLIGLSVYTRINEKSNKMRLVVASTIVFFAIGLILGNFVTDNAWLSFALVCFAAFFLQPSTALANAIPPKVFSAEVQGAARGLIGTLGALGAFFGPYLVGYIKETTSSTSMALVAIAVILILGALTSFALPERVDVKVAK